MKFAGILIIVIILTAGILPITSCQEIASPLEDFNWVMTKFGDPTNYKTPVAGTEISAHFDSKTKIVTGSAGCNDFSAPYSVDHLTVTITGPLTVTKMACGGETGALETGFFGMFKNVTGFEMEQGQLILFSGNNRLYFKQTDQPLKTVTHWGE
jgi:heat shock protein HslJ